MRGVKPTNYPQGIALTLALAKTGLQSSDVTFATLIPCEMSGITVRYKEGFRYRK